MPALRVRVLAAAAELGYQPNYVAQSLRRGATDLIGFVASDLSDPFSAEIVAGAEFVLRPAGYALLVMSSNHDPDHRCRECSLPATAVGSTRSWSRRPARTIAACSPALAEFDGPIVVLESELRGHLPVDAVVCRSSERHARGRRAICSDLGHRRIAALTGPVARRSGRERLAGLLDALARLTGSRTARCRSPPSTTPTIAEARDASVSSTGRHRRRPCSPAVMPLLVGTLRAIDRRGLAIGRDIAARRLGRWAAGPNCRTRRSRSSTAIRAGSAWPRRRWRSGASAHGGTRDDGPARVEIRRRGSCRARLAIAAGRAPPRRRSPGVNV